MNPYAHSVKVLTDLRKESDSIIVSYSGGKDPLVMLDMCSKIFPKVYAFFMYMVKDISFQKRMLDYAVKAYGVEIKQYPSPGLIKCLKYNMYCLPNRRYKNLKLLKLSDIYNMAREDFGDHYIATGWKMNDSLERRIVLNQLPDKATDHKFKKIFPLAYWRKRDIASYMRLHSLPIPENLGIESFDIELTYKVLSPIKERYPHDYEKIKAVFPFIDTVLFKGTLNGNN